MQKKSNRLAGWVIAGALAVVAAGALYSAPVIAQASRMARLRTMMAGLDLTADQKAKIKEILAQESPKVQPLIKQLEHSHLAMQVATENHYDAARVRAFADRQGKLVSDLTVEGVLVKEKIFKVLTPAQRAKAEEDESRLDEYVAGIHYGDVVNELLN